MHSFFSSALGRTEHSTGWAHMQSVHACAVQTHFLVFVIFFKKTSQSVQHWSILESFLLPNVIFVWKKALQKSISNYVQAQRLPDSAVLDRNSNIWTETISAAPFWVHFWVLFLESVISESISGKLLIFWWDLNPKAADLTRPGQGPVNFYIWSVGLRV